MNVQPIVGFWSELTLGYALRGGLQAGLSIACVLGPLIGVSSGAIAFERQSYASAPGMRRTVYAACDRALVRECQADARRHVQFCEAFPGRRACADRALNELQMCWASTGCW